MNPPGKPQVLVAAFFERVEDDPRGRWNLLGHTDAVDLAVGGEGPIPALRHTLTLALILGTRGIAGEHTITLRYVDPAGRALAGEERHTLKLDGSADGFRARRKSVVEFPPDPEPGFYALEIEWDGEPLCAVPLKLRIRRTSGAPYP